MVQSINIKALTTLASVIRRPYLASPHVQVNTISELNYTALRDRCGIKAIIFDKDNTLTAPYEISTHPLALPGLRSALETFGHTNVAILSNSAGTNDDPDYRDAAAIETHLGVSVIRHAEKKPGGLSEVLKHFEGCGVTAPSELCVVGDRLLTDVVFGNLYGMLTVHTLPLCRGEENRGDNLVAACVRSVENKALYADWFGGRMVRERTLPHKVWPGEAECPLVMRSDVGDGRE
mmetsp:Transcript_41646/g.50680  ORF Transcript_41646/g.50680 Transcript_41646/m.50680 type:complete len:234 (+) Transcript_41646:204-905(+)|eukprot:CAMPEP_0172506668 /NCGR_PEP_ID=MMETSP1066-20121228/197123_1 /TAXON_ID=671091 /ORGANISM="Coscinodiscus wailesii, Strain CCMP2513" /LENGTH=233 /DNA_ID=CAMNT_0013283799 /DNA_START=187 /DNA_END=888 /DNA_ORIENTATION=+